jgi:methionyl-tRNA formyltransferase
VKRAVVFAYHNVGVRCLKALLAGGVEVALVVTHNDNPAETVWYDSVRRTAEDYGLPCITPDDPNTDAVLQRVRALDPDFVFSFYYRLMLKAPLLACARNGAYNMHGSLLPKYRGRVPINWAIIHGETETGATLHRMNDKPDNGEIVDQMAVPILADDSALDVFAKVTVAAEIVLLRSLPALIDCSAKLIPQDLTHGAYFGARSAADGRIDWALSAQCIHDLVRAVTRPFPGATCDLGSRRLTLWQTRVSAELPNADPPCLFLRDGELHARCGDGGVLHILHAELDGERFDAVNWRRCGLPSVLPFSLALS